MSEQESRLFGSESDDVDNDGEVDESPEPSPDPDGEIEQGWPGEPQRDLVEMRPPSMDTGGFRQLYRTRKWLKKRQKLIGDGYVQWYLIGDAVNHPRFIKPDRKGGGIPEYEHDGETYLFPRDALVPSEDGMWTCIHRVGEADPINIRDPARYAIKADELKEYLDLRVSSSAPGLLDGLGIDAGDAVKIMIALIIAYAVFQQVVGGGF